MFHSGKGVALVEVRGFGHVSSVSRFSLLVFQKNVNLMGTRFAILSVLRFSWFLDTPT